MTKKQMAMVDAYNRTNARALDDVYGSYSAAKKEAYSYCRGLQYKMKGYDGRIPSANSFAFTYAFRYKENGDEYMCYCTSCNDYKFKIA